MRPDLYQIPGRWRGHLAIAGRPRGGDWLKDEAAAWRRAGIDVVVSLLEDAEAGELGLSDEPEAMQGECMRFFSLPIPDRGVPASMPAVAALIARITEALGAGQSVAVHCRQGLGRSSLISAGVLVAEGMAPAAAIAAVRAARGREVPETREQREWIENAPLRPQPAVR